MADLRGWLERAWRYLQGRHPDDSPLGAHGVKELAALLSPSWDLRPLLAAEIEAEGQELARLTEEQFVMLDFLGRHRRAAISGCVTGRSVVSSLYAPFVGAWSDKYGPRKFVLFGVLLVGLSYLLAARINNIWELFQTG